jgi:hypothetical protein
LVALLIEFINRHKAGSPTDSAVFWIHLRAKELAERFETSHGYKVSHGFVKRILKTQGFKYRKLRKNLATGQYARRDEQFEQIFKLVALMSLDTPILSIDCKKKECLGNLYRAGKCWSDAPVEVYDHDYQHLAQGKVIPHGIYDLGRNEGYVSIGSSHETAEFIKDNLLWWWDNFGIHHYPKARTILILCDAGGANSYRHHAFKVQMLLLSQAIGMDIIICHYPPYASKWNPIEHRLFCHVHQAIQGVVFSDYDQVKQLISNTSTKSGLTVQVRLNLKNYPIGIKTTSNQVDFNRVHFSQNIPELAYRIAA